MSPRPIGPSSNCSARSSVSCAGSTTQRRTSSSTATAGCSASGRSSPRTPTGTPAVISARRSVPSTPAVERTTTAIRDQGMPSRCARRSVPAMNAASSLAVRNRPVRTSPAACSDRRRPAVGARPGRAAAPRRGAWPRAGRARCGATRTARRSAPRRRRRIARRRRGSRTRRHRGTRRSTGRDRRRGCSSSAPSASSAISSPCAGSVSWYSSTKIRRRRARSAASSCGSASKALSALRISSAGSYPPGCPSAVTPWYSVRNRPGRDPVRTAAALPERRQLRPVQAALDRSHQQVAQFARERVGAQRRTDLGRPLRGIAVLPAGRAG